ncbi:MAG: ABC transporter permease [Actinobacteria bacterium]|nr:ABC transporter permease [Actinomycetota bacterium]
MDIIWEGIKKAFILIFSGDSEVYEILFLTIKVSGSAVFFSMILGIPIGIAVGLNKFPGKKFVTSVINTGMGVPPVAVGLIVALFIWRSGPLGFLEIMYTPTAMVVAQIIIAAPIIAGITLASVQQINPKMKLQALSLGANRFQVLWILIREARLPALAAIMAGFGGVISEVGAVIMVGGNIKGETRVLTTATVQNVRMGKFDVAIALVIILLALTFGVNLILTLIQQKEGGNWLKRS